jgi:flagellar biosynthesis GTPase FlhF
LPVQSQARAALAKRIKTKSGWRGKRRMVALVGTHGSGKTLTAAKLCHAYAIGGGLSVGLLSLEAPRCAMQLGLLTEGIGVDFQIADHPSQVALAAGRVDAGDLIVVDTPGADAGDIESVERLERLLLALRPDETHFLVPASADIEPSRALLEALAGRIGVDRILITRLDEAPALGAHVALSISSRLPISYLASGGAASYGLAPADPFALAGMVLP